MSAFTKKRWLFVLITIAFVTGGVRLENGSARLAIAQGVGVLRSIDTGRTWLVGVAAGQELQLIVGQRRDAIGDPITYTFTIDIGGAPLFQSERITVPAGQWRKAKVTREQLKTEGERGTERIEVMVRLSIEGSPGTNEADVFGALSIVDQNTGRTTVQRPFGDFLLHNIRPGDAAADTTWALSSGEDMRVCLGNNLAQAPPTETISLNFVSIRNELGQSVVEKELPVETGQFSCIDFSQPSLVAAGLVPEANGRVNFALNLTVKRRGIADSGGNETPSASPEVAFGAIETVHRDTGQSRIYLGIHWSFDNTETRGL